MKRLTIGLLACLTAVGAERRIHLRPPLWVDADDRPIPEPSAHRVSELYEIVYTSWLRHLNAGDKAAAARDPGALNVNAWDEVPDSSWFTNRIGRQRMSREEILAGPPGRPPGNGKWTVYRIEDEGYTPKVSIRNAAGDRYMVKFDPSVPRKNSGAERISTLIVHAAGYNVPNNTLVYFRESDLILEPKASYTDALGHERRLTAADLDAGLKRPKPLADGRYRGVASQILEGSGIGKFEYSGVRKDDPNDIVPHELRRELRGLRVIAAWINHVDVGNKNTMDTYVPGGKRGYVRHHLLDFGSTLGSGDFINGPYRVGHEYIFDGAATGRSFITLGLWRRPWQAGGRIVHDEIGYYDADLFEPEKWKPNYPNLAFIRMDAADAYWGAKIVTAFDDALIRALVEAGEYSGPEVSGHLARMMRLRRDAIGRHWFDRVSPLENFAIADGHLVFRDLGVERGYCWAGERRYEIRQEKSAVTFDQPAVRLQPVRARGTGEPDRHGRLPIARVWVRSNRSGGGWALPVEVTLGMRRGSDAVEVLGWRHAAEWPR